MKTFFFMMRIAALMVASTVFADADTIRLGGADVQVIRLGDTAKDEKKDDAKKEAELLNGGEIKLRPAFSKESPPLGLKLGKYEFWYGLGKGETRLAKWDWSALQSTVYLTDKWGAFLEFAEYDGRTTAGYLFDGTRIRFGPQLRSETTSFGMAAQNTLRATLWRRDDDGRNASFRSQEHNTGAGIRLAHDMFSSRKWFSEINLAAELDIDFDRGKDAILSVNPVAESAPNRSEFHADVSTSVYAWSFRNDKTKFALRANFGLDRVNEDPSTRFRMGGGARYTLRIGRTLIIIDVLFFHSENHGPVPNTDGGSFGVGFSRDKKRK